IPYVGPAVMVMILFGVGLVTFPSFSHALLAPIGFIALTTAEGHFITPTIVGRKITLNPLLVFLALAFWTWLWGPIGAFLAAPLSIVGLVVFNHISPQGDAKLPDCMELFGTCILVAANSAFDAWRRSHEHRVDDITHRPQPDEGRARSCPRSAAGSVRRFRRDAQRCAKAARGFPAPCRSGCGNSYRARQCRLEPRQVERGRRAFGRAGQGA